MFSCFLEGSRIAATYLVPYLSEHLPKKLKESNPFYFAYFVIERHLIHIAVPLQCSVRSRWIGDGSYLRVLSQSSTNAQHT
jgi:hypothetical protein